MHTGQTLVETEWKESVAVQGFAVIPGVFCVAEMNSVLREIANAASRRSKAGMRHVLDLPAVHQLAGDGRLLAIAQAVLGDRAFPFRATLFDKSRDANWLVVWHQDTALPLKERHDEPGWGPWSTKAGVLYAHAPAMALSQILALRVHIDNSSADNGPLRVLPRTHNLGVLSDPAIEQLTQLAPVECLCPKGGVVAMRPLIVHGSSKSRTGEPRRVLHIEYAASAEVANDLQLAMA